MERFGAWRPTLLHQGGNQAEEVILLDEDYPLANLEDTGGELWDEELDYDESQLQSAQSSEDEDEAAIVNIPTTPPKGHSITVADDPPSPQAPPDT